MPVFSTTRILNMGSYRSNYGDEVILFYNIISQHSAHMYDDDPATAATRSPDKDSNRHVIAEQQ